MKSTNTSFRLLKSVLLLLFCCQLAACDSSSEDDDGSDDIPGVPQSCTNITDCAMGELCRFPDGTCGAQGEPGVCQPAPEVCTLQFLPVCGCDGATYGNRCSALAEGVSIFAETACGNIVQREGELCGGPPELPCAAGFFCKFEEGSCGVSGGFGFCMEVPFNCAVTQDFVCGCDGMNYQNECFADAAGVSLLVDGPC